MDSRMNVEEGDEAREMGLTPYDGEVEQVEGERTDTSLIRAVAESLDSDSRPESASMNSENEVLEAGEEEVSQLLIDESVTTLICSKRKGVNSISKPCRKLFSVPTKSFCDKLDKCLSSSELLPRNVRYYVSSSRGSILVLEEEPCTRSISVNYNFESTIENLRATGKLEEFGYTDFLKNNEPPYRFTLSFPYIVYIIEIFSYPRSPARRLSVFYRNAPLTSLYDSLFKCNLLNIDSRSVCCMGDVQLPKDADLTTKVNIILDSFWNSTFNTDITEHYNSYGQNPHLSTFLHWQYYSNKDPMFILSENLIPADQILNSAVNRLSNEDGDDTKLLNSYRSVVDLLLDEECVWNENESLFSVAEMPLTKDGIVLDSGEEIWIDKKKYFVVDFLRNNVSFVTMRVEDEESKVEDISLTSEVIKSLVKQIKSKRYIESVIIKDQLVKPGRIITFSGEGHHTNVIHKIFKDRDSTILTKCGEDYYVLENVDFTTFDEDEIRVHGVKLEKGKKYIVITLRNEHLPYFYRTELSNAVTYDGFVDFDSDDDYVSLKFGEIRVPFDSLNQYNIFHEQEIEKLEVARYGQKLLEGCSRVKGNGLFAKNSRPVLLSTISKLIRDIIERQELLIQSYDFDIKFSVGDKVVIPDWSKPETVTEIRTITGFEVAPNAECIYIVSTNNQGRVSRTNYLSFQPPQRVNAGSVRKISDEFNGIKAGFKLIAKVRGIQNFMKKDCHEVVGFITDTGNGMPLMLCSNLCTIWCTKDDLEKFDFFEPSSSKFKKLQTSPLSLASINFQPGDLIFSNRSNIRCCEDRVLLLLSKSGFKGMYTVMRPDNINVCRCYQVVDKTTFFYGIPSPRTKLDTKSFIDNKEFVRLVPYPGFHNTMIDISNRNYGNSIYIRREEISNVSDLFSR